MALLFSMRYLITCLAFCLPTYSSAQLDSLVLVSSTTIYFDNASFEIRADQAYKMDSVLHTIQKSEHPRITIQAHTDQVGESTYNEILSKSRANALADYFIANEVDSSSIETRFYGEEQLVSTDEDQDSYQQNRRAQINIYRPKPILWLHGKVIDSKTDSPLVATVFFHSKFLKKTIMSDSSGAFKIKVEKDKVVGINTTLPGYLNSKKMTKTSENILKRPLIIKLERGDGRWLEGEVLSDSGEYVSNANVQMNSVLWSDITKTDSLGGFKLFVPKTGNISLDIIAKDYLIGMRSLEVTPKLFKKPIEVKLPRIAEGKKFDIHRLYFIGGRDFLLEKSFNVLPQLQAFMEVNQDQCIRIDGHINGPNAPKSQVYDPDHDLSVARARRIYRFLLSKGVDEDRMAYKGFGNWHMVYPTAIYEDEMAKNRRVEITIMNCAEIAAMPNDSISPKTSLFTFVPQTYDTYISTKSDGSKKRKSVRLD